MPEIPSQVSFTVSAKGEVSGKALSGLFTVKTRLSFKEQLARDQKRRELIGPQKGDPQDEQYKRTLNTADIFSDLYVRVVKGPSWWMDADRGLDLEDDAIVGAVYTKAMEAIMEASKPLTEEAEKAAAELKTEAAQPVK